MWYIPWIEVLWMRNWRRKKNLFPKITNLCVDLCKWNCWRSSREGPRTRKPTTRSTSRCERKKRDKTGLGILVKLQFSILLIISRRRFCSEIKVSGFDEKRHSVSFFSGGASPPIRWRDRGAWPSSPFPAAGAHSPRHPPSHPHGAEAWVRDADQEDSSGQLSL